MYTSTKGRQVTSKTTLSTYKEWNADGYYILAGSRAVDFDEKGNALFKYSQVATKKHYYHTYSGYKQIPRDSSDYDNALDCDLAEVYDLQWKGS